MTSRYITQVLVWIVETFKSVHLELAFRVMWNVDSIDNFTLFFSFVIK